MPMRSLSRLLAVGLTTGAVVAALYAAPARSQAPGEAVGATYEVTVTNLTRGQIFSPLFAATHSSAVALFQAGDAASPELAALAEDGDLSQLMQLFSNLPGVGDVQGGAGMILPGQSETLTLRTSGSARELSLATMLVSTNDTFTGFSGLTLPANEASFTSVAYDAGSEFDSELCAFIPGPPCGNGGVHDPTPAEGFIHVDAGIQGVGDLVAAERDWRNPVARITIRRLP